MSRSWKGYLVHQGNQSTTFRVPAEHFQAVLDSVMKLGDVVHRDVQARDVTEEFSDVQTRTRTLEALRGRFEELLRRAGNVQEALAVERELGRVVDEIERLKGRLKLLRELISFSTITVEFRPRAVESLKSNVQFAVSLAEDAGPEPLAFLVNFREAFDLKSKIDGRFMATPGPRLRSRMASLLISIAALGCSVFRPATPPGFVELPDQDDYDYRATTADGVVIAVRAIEHEPGGELSFWVRAIEKHAREQNGYALLETLEVKNAQNLSGKQLRFGHDEGKHPHLYYVTLFVTPRSST